MQEPSKPLILPKLPAEQIKKYKRSHRWPPPAGLVIFPQTSPSDEKVVLLLNRLAGILSPEDRDVVERAKASISRD